MDSTSTTFDYGSPFTGTRLTKLKDFLQTQGLDYENGIEYTVNICEDSQIIGTGSLEQNVIKCVAVLRKSEGLSAKIASELIKYAFSLNRTHLFVFTKPENREIFMDFGFYTVAQTSDVILMENKKDGAYNFANSIKVLAQSQGILRNPEQNQEIGAVVVNCNPLTNGHMYLFENASKFCDLLYVFVLSEDRSFFSANVRLELVKKCTAHLKNLVVFTTGDYMVSSKTFPTYFIKDKAKVEDIGCLLDLKIFCECFSSVLNIKKRFVGTEPFCKVTNRYNELMKQELVKCGIEVIEIPRFEENDRAVSASYVRKLMGEGNFEEIKPLVPETTYEFIKSEQGQNIAKKIRESEKNG